MDRIARLADAQWAKMVRIIAATAARCFGAACASMLRVQWTRQRWRPASKTRRAAALRPLWSSAHRPPCGRACGDDELHASEAAVGERAEELGPEDLGLGGAGGDAQDLAAAVGVDGHGAPATFHVAELQGVPGRERPGGTATLTIRPPWRDLR